MIPCAGVEPSLQTEASFSVTHTAAAPTALYAGRLDQKDVWGAALAAAAQKLGLSWRLALEPAEVAPEAVDYLIYAPNGEISDMRAFPNLRAVLSLWAGVETILRRSDLPDAPIARMVEPGLQIGMTDYVVAHVMRAHLDLDATRARHAARRWDETHPRLSCDRPVGVLGLGALGLDAARALHAVGFPVSGWSRSPKTAADGVPEGVAAYAGLDTLETFLAHASILVILLPLTPDTEGLLNGERLAALPAGAHVINAARGPILPEEALLDALGPADAPEAGRLAGATLDVFAQEPLPDAHPYWRHPKVLVTPHIASVTRPETASLEIVRQIIRDQSGEGLRHVVDRRLGY